MPDHVHLFCAPGIFPPTPVKKWVEYWKGIVARAAKGYGPLVKAGTGVTSPARCHSGGGPGSTPANLAAGAGVAYAKATAAVRIASAKWPDPLWEQDCWDTQLRRGENYSAKWEYVRRNPVRAGLCARPEEWPFQGEMKVLRWHD
jgi:REP element-mobilizing transposase RayT